MAWSTPTNFTTGAVLTEAQMDAISNNLLETLVAKVTTAGDMGYATAANALTRLAIGAANFHLSSTGSAPVWRGYDTHLSAASSTTSSGTYADLALGSNPTVTVTTGTVVLVGISAQAENSGANVGTRMSFTTSGATTQAADDDRSWGATSPIANASYVGGNVFLIAVTAGTNTFTAKYRVSGNTGTWQNRRIWAWAL